MCVESWGKVIRERLDILESWAHKQGLELAAECHLAKINQCADFLQVNTPRTTNQNNHTHSDLIQTNEWLNCSQAAKTSEEDVQKLACSCFRLNSLQMAALLSQEKIPRNLIDTAIRMAESVADELTRGDDREVGNMILWLNIFQDIPAHSPLAAVDFNRFHFHRFALKSRWSYRWHF